MTKLSTAKIFKNGRSQAVRLPKEFRFEGKRVLISRLPDGKVLLEPVSSLVSKAEWFAALDNHRDGEFMKKGRNQPKPQRRKKLFR